MRRFCVTCVASDILNPELDTQAYFKYIIMIGYMTGGMIGCISGGMTVDMIGDIDRYEDAKIVALSRLSVDYLLYDNKQAVLLS